MIIARENKYESIKDLKILNFYSDWCPPCHAFMPNFIEAEKTFWKYYDFIIINTWENQLLSQEFSVRWTPTIIIIKNNEKIHRQSWVPNWSELKHLMIELIWKEVENKWETKKKKFFGLF